MKKHEPVIVPDFSHYDNHVQITTASGQTFWFHYNNGAPERILLDAYRRLQLLRRQKLTAGTTVPAHDEALPKSSATNSEHTRSSTTRQLDS